MKLNAGLAIQRGILALRIVLAHNFASILARIAFRRAGTLVVGRTSMVRSGSRCTLVGTCRLPAS